MLRAVFDTNTVLSALAIAGSRLAWLRPHWGHGCVPLVSRDTTEELVRVLGYPKFRLSPADREELMAEYLPYCEIVAIDRRCNVLCRDPKDQAFLDLAHAGKADVLVTGDRDLLALAAKTAFAIELPEAYRLRVTAV